MLSIFGLNGPFNGCLDIFMACSNMLGMPPLAPWVHVNQPKPWSCLETSLMRSTPLDFKSQVEVSSLKTT